MLKYHHGNNDSCYADETSGFRVWRKITILPSRMRRVPLIVAVTTAVILTAMARTAVRAWFPVQDEATVWLRTMDVGGAHTPLTGAFSRLGWHHPGPALYFAYAPFVRLLGGSTSGLLVAALVVSLASAGGIVALAARTGARVALVFGVATAILCIGWGDRLIDPWNPFICVLPFGTFLVASWLVSVGDPVGMPWACVTGSFAAQSHLGAVPPVVLIGAVAGGLRIATRPPDRRLRVTPGMLRALLLLAILWAAPIIDQLFGKSPNGSAILQFLLRAHDTKVGFRAALLMTGGQLAPWGPWLGREPWGMFGEVLPAPVWQLAVVVALVVVSAVMAARSGDVHAKHLVALEVAAVTATVVAHAEVRGICFYYLVLWTRPVAMLIVVAPIVIGARFASAITPTFRSSLIALVLGALAVSIAARAAFAEVPAPFFSRLYATLGEHALGATSPGQRVRIAPLGAFFTVSPEGLMAALEGGGRRPRLSPWYATAVGSHRTVPPTAKLDTLLVASGYGVEQAMSYASTVVYIHDPLSPSERAIARTLRMKLEKELAATGRVDLIESLRDASGWLGLVAPSGIDHEALNRYLRLVGGLEKMPVALYMMRKRPWPGD